MSFPNMSEVFSDWQSAITLRVARKTNVGGDVVEVPIADKIVRGVLEPIPNRKLLVKPEGQRDWKWYTLWTTEYLENDMILIDADGKTYRIMGQGDWQGAGYLEYELTQGENA